MHREPFVINLTDTRCAPGSPFGGLVSASWWLLLAASCTGTLSGYATHCRQFVNQPGPSNEPLQCRILRQRVGTLRAADQYILQVCHSGQHLVGPC